MSLSMGQLLASLATGFISSAIIFWLAKNWLLARLNASIQHHYNKSLEEYRFEIKMREQATLIAALLSTWTYQGVDKEAIRRELNKLSYEASLWLPDDVFLELAKVLTHHPEAISPKELLVRVRKIIRNSDTKITAGDIIHF